MSLLHAVPDSSLTHPGREQERQEELEAEHRRKAEEVARLRAMQEKQNDRAAEMDALRAKRAAEDYERSWRERVNKFLFFRQETLTRVISAGTS